ncbi:MAG TPA: HemK/PrmC family methyltransferase, partial [Sphingobacteriaceae bacterium]|nr:HemK/PrmC family methyltransferase [Sphingobacteriaceae bacterium]
MVKSHLSNSPRIIDIGTGSGCIALALKKSLPDAEVYAMDISGEALEVARRNANSLGLEINFIQADILEWELVVDSDLRFDLVVSNPPYITPTEKMEMENHVLDFEPDLALFVPEESPLLFYQYIADFARHHLLPDGKLYFEINQKYGRDIRELLSKKGFNNVRIMKDMQGVDRIIEAEQIK